MYKIELSATVYKFLGKSKIPFKILNLTKQKILSLQDEPRPPGCEKLKSSMSNYYRIRQGDFRVVYEINDKEKAVFIIYIGHRKEIYRNF
ncbi:MAG: type II toxin-antitoxin system RelE/ParE family toxin [Candidatus Goldbacteria bacterium]|nr:type II toxin-antitoxin system RelE/ParE family toxin [Candidatus Goldiibacteriota bacterium]